MSKNNFTSQLLRLGLSDAQAKLYLSLLELKEATVVELAKLSGLGRPTIYDNANQLEELGLLNWVVVKGKKKLSVEKPDTLHDMLKQKEKLVEDLVPRLENIYEKNPSTASVKFYRGEEGARHLAQVILASKDKKILTIGDYHRIFGMFTNNYLRNFWEKRVRKNIKALTLFNHTDMESLMKNPDFSHMGNIKYNREARIMPKGIELEVVHTIVDDQVLLWSSEDDSYYFLFKSKGHADSIRSMFKFIWKQSEPLNP